MAPQRFPQVLRKVGLKSPPYYNISASFFFFIDYILSRIENMTIIVTQNFAERDFFFFFFFFFCNFAPKMTLTSPLKFQTLPYRLYFSLLPLPFQKKILIPPDLPITLTRVDLFYEHSIYRSSCAWAI